MKARGPLPLLVCALVALALPAGALGAPPKKPELRLTSFALEGTNGYGVEVSSMGEGDSIPVVLVSADGGLLGASYEVRAEPGAGLRATFGSLGRLDVSFERREKRVRRPEPGCRWVVERGVFRGSFDFTGEESYFSSSAVDPEGEVFRLPNGPCGSLGIDRPAPLSIPAPTQIILSAQAREGGRTISFQASRLSFAGAHLTSFSASLRERVGEMRIERRAKVEAADKSFSTPKESRAGVSPPPPFRGSARFRDPARGPATWTGSLSVSLPGVPDVALAGPTFAARLCPATSLLRSCLRYGSGSHSQPLALARLSSLR